MKATNEFRWPDWWRAGSLLLLLSLLLAGSFSYTSSALNNKPDKFRPAGQTSIQEARAIQFHLPEYFLKTNTDFESERENTPVVRQVFSCSPTVSLVLPGRGILSYIFFPDLRETLHSLLFPYHHFW